MRAIFRLALGEGLLVAVIGRGKVIDAGQQRSEHLAVVDDAADRSTAEADAVIAALAADQAGARALTLNCRKIRGPVRRAQARQCGLRARRPGECRTGTVGHSPEFRPAWRSPRK